MRILQEAARPKKVLLRCGYDAAWLKSFLAAAPAQLHTFLQGIVSISDHENDDDVKCGMSFTRLVEARTPDQPGLGTLSLDSLLAIFRRSDATVPV